MLAAGWRGPGRGPGLRGVHQEVRHNKPQATRAGGCPHAAAEARRERKVRRGPGNSSYSASQGTEPGLEVLVFSLVLSTWGWLCYGLSVLPKATELR